MSSPRISFLPSDPEGRRPVMSRLDPVLDEVAQMDRQLLDRTQEGGTNSRGSSAVRGGVVGTDGGSLARVDALGDAVDSPTAPAARGVVSDRPDTWLLEGYARLLEATDAICTIGYHAVVGPQK